MSVSGEGISNVRRSIENGGGNYEEEEEGGCDGIKGNKGNGCGYSGNFRKAKRVAFFPFRKAKKSFLRASNGGKSSSSPSAIARSSGKMVGGDGSVKGCYFCFSKSKTLESPPESETSDPNDPNFTYEMLRALLESNDFYSKECNPHIDISDTTD